MSEEIEKKKSVWPMLILLGVIFFPGAILGFSVWSLFRYKKNKPSVTAAVGGTFASIGLLLIVFNVKTLLDFENFSGISLALIWLGLSFIIGFSVAQFYVLSEARRMRNNPHLVKLEGSWRYKFKYKKSPLEKFKKKKTVEKLQSGILVETDKAPLGIDIATDEPVFRFDSEARKHTYMIGASGAGKTMTMLNLISADIETGKTVIAIDFKRSPKFASKLAAWAKENGREFYHFVNGDPEDYDIPASKGQCYYDALKSGTPTSKADMVLGMREYDSNAAVYKAAMQQLLQVLFAMLQKADRKEAREIDWNHGGIYQLASAMSGNAINELARACSIEVPPGPNAFEYVVPGSAGPDGKLKTQFVNTPIAKNAIELAEALKSKGPLNQAKEELQGQMRTIMASEYGRWMKTGNSADEREIDLFELTKEGGNVIVFSLNSDSEPEFAQYVGSMIFSDLTNISALRRNTGSSNQVNIYVDEFQAVPPTAVMSLLEKSRESAMAMTLAQQSFDQVVASAPSNGEAYLNSILDTCSNFVAHAGSTEDSATRLSKILGKEWQTVYTRTNSNDSSITSSSRRQNDASMVGSKEEERWICPPERFMKLSFPDPSNNYKSTMVWLTKNSSDPKYAGDGGALARTVWVIPNERVLHEYYNGKEKELARRRVAVKTKQDQLYRTEEDKNDSNDYEVDLYFLNKKEDYTSEPEDYSESNYRNSMEDFSDYDPRDSYTEEEEDWGIIEVPETEYSSESFPTAPIEESALEERKNAVARADFDSVADLFKSGPPASQQKKPQEKAPALPKIASPIEKTQKSGGGLPTRRVVSPSKAEDIDSLQLPEL